MFSFVVLFCFVLVIKKLTWGQKLGLYIWSHVQCLWWRQSGSRTLKWFLSPVNGMFHTHTCPYSSVQTLLSFFFFLFHSNITQSYIRLDCIYSDQLFWNWDLPMSELINLEFIIKLVNWSKHQRETTVLTHWEKKYFGLCGKFLPSLNCNIYSISITGLNAFFPALVFLDLFQMLQWCSKVCQAFHKFERKKVVGC